MMNNQTTKTKRERKRQKTQRNRIKKEATRKRNQMRLKRNPSEKEETMMMRKQKCFKKTSRVATHHHSYCSFPSQENSSDEDVNQLNQVANQTSEFKSIKDLPIKKMHRVLKIEILETVNGRTVRLQLEDKSIEEGYCFVHLPRRFLPSVESNYSKYAQITKSKKPFFFACSN
ncbi:uncharacterized protein LOC117648094 [Thrips palmi]|uniref:Uncharacterized protein LOC117648094 n=1 Tax=Thrips palmi TaxID=161013 RepID=A0A6P8Z7B5_THRPL|nr:uncharacterized protein LOC117648094 [Thrips palmi]